MRREQLLPSPSPTPSTNFLSSPSRALRRAPLPIRRWRGCYNNFGSARLHPPREVTPRTPLPRRLRRRLLRLPRPRPRRPPPPTTTTMTTTAAARRRRSLTRRCWVRPTPTRASTTSMHSPLGWAARRSNACATVMRRVRGHCGPRARGVRRSRHRRASSAGVRVASSSRSCRRRCTTCKSTHLPTTRRTGQPSPYSRAPPPASSGRSGRPTSCFKPRPVSPLPLQPSACASCSRACSPAPTLMAPLAPSSPGVERAPAGPCRWMGAASSCGSSRRTSRSPMGRPSPLAAATRRSTCGCSRRSSGAGR
mmetsp:Transcript_10137/g.21961  ORF Transcript_10137/g.21961 Transcript_10137/m.21961 type:complete len:308 (+) Transcript_10137:597-1520(+)